MAEVLAFIRIPATAEEPVNIPVRDDLRRRHHAAAIQGVLAPIARRPAAAKQ
jgi:hypothetical protein